MPMAKASLRPGRRPKPSESSDRTTGISRLCRLKRNMLILAVGAAALGLIGRLQDVDKGLGRSLMHRATSEFQKYSRESLVKANGVSDQDAMARTEPTPSQPPTQAQSQGPTFQGTKITQISPGMDLFENVCITRGTHRTTNQILSFTADGAPMKSSSFKYMRPPSWASWTAILHGNKLKSWTDMIQSPRVALVTNETLLTLNIWGNPGHCLNDLVFPLAFDAYNRSLHINREGPIYPSYLYAYFKALKTDQYDQPEWCFEFLRHAGLIDPERGLVARAEPTICFERLLVPMLLLYRFPVDWSDEDSRASLTNYPWGSQIPRAFNFQSTKYPQQALQLLKDKFMQGSGLNNTSWQQQESVTSIENEPNKNVTILFYGRQGIHTRSLKNSQEVVDQLEKEYNAKVDLVDQPKWSQLLLNVSAQMTLFNRYSHIVLVHGAHQSNQMACRSNTRIVEIVPGGATPEPSLKARLQNETKTSLEWYGQAGWFSCFTRRLSQEHFVIGEPGYNLGSKTFSVNVKRTVDFIANRFGLKKRKSDRSAESLRRKRENELYDFEIDEDMPDVAY